MKRPRWYPLSTLGYFAAILPTNGPSRLASTSDRGPYDRVGQHFREADTGVDGFRRSVRRALSRGSVPQLGSIVPEPNGNRAQSHKGAVVCGSVALVLGRDFSGVVSTVGSGVEDLKIGDSVFGVFEAGQEGAYAEKLAVKAAIIAKKPDGLSHVSAAAVALTGLTALSAIRGNVEATGR